MAGSPPVRRLRLTVRELRGQLVVLVVVLSAVAAVNTFTSTRYLRSGQLKGTDFVQFYTLATLAARGHIGDFTNFDAVHALQVSLVPESTGRFYPLVYGPQIALALRPLAHLTYERALLVWTAASVLVYFGLLILVAASSPGLRPYLGTALLGAAGFPPFWQLLQHGQLSIVALVAIVGGWWALRQRHCVLAGVCLGLLAYKPPLFAPVLIVLVLAGSWRIASAAAVAAAGQILLAGVWVGWDGLVDYATMLASLPGMAPLLAVRPEQMHSLRTFWELLIPSPPGALLLYGVSAGAAIATAAYAWRRLTDPSLRMVVLALVTVLSAPHLFVYDLVLVAPAWMWLVDWFVRQSPGPHVARILHLGYLAPLAAPFVPLVRVQLSTLCVAALLAFVVRWASAQHPGPPDAREAPGTTSDASAPEWLGHRHDVNGPRAPAARTPSVRDRCM